MNSNSRVKIQVLAGNGNLKNLTGARITIYKIEETVSAFVGDFGNFYEYSFDALLNITVSSSLVPRLSNTFTIYTTAPYRISWETDWDMSAPSYEFIAKLKIDGIEIDAFQALPNSVGVFQKMSSFVNVSLDPGSHTITFFVSTSNILSSINTKNVKIEVFRTL